VKPDYSEKEGDLEVGTLYFAVRVIRSERPLMASYHAAGLEVLK
jgi:hypothetical protein